MATSFATSILPMFRPVDIAHMAPFGVALDDYAYASFRGASYAADALVDEIEEAAADVERLGVRIAAIEKQLVPFVERLAPSLLALRGVSSVVAAGLIGHAGLLNNCRNAAAFAMRAGAAPVPC